jgi:hypothetical protein
MTFSIDSGKIFTDGTVLSASDLNTAYTDIENEFNGTTNTANPAWVREVLITTSTITSGTNRHTVYFSGYSRYRIQFWNITEASGGTQNVNLKFNGDATATAYTNWFGIFNTSTGGTVQSYSASALDLGNIDANNVLYADLVVQAAPSGNNYHPVMVNACATLGKMGLQGNWTSSATITSSDIGISGGLMAGGTVNVYGIK